MQKRSPQYLQQQQDCQLPSISIEKPELRPMFSLETAMDPHSQTLHLTPYFLIHQLHPSRLHHLLPTVAFRQKKQLFSRSLLAPIGSLLLILNWKEMQSSLWCAEKAVHDRVHAVVSAIPCTCQSHTEMALTEHIYIYGRMVNMSLPESMI